MCKSNRTLVWLAFIFVILGLLAALAPLSDFDQDGNLDSLVTEGFVWIPVICSVTGLFALLTRLPAACFAVSQQFLPRLVPPPIAN
jgi:hypothetical protein